MWVRAEGYVVLTSLARESGRRSYEQKRPATEVAGPVF
jgi:hypothetical protein